jgi:hypothetical protein
MESKNEEKVPKAGATQNNTYIHSMLCHGKIGQENSINDISWALIPWALFHHLFLLLDF